MSNKARDEKPRGLKPVQSVELSENHFKTRWILVGVFVVIALVALGVMLSEWLTEDAGWVEIEATASQLHCGEDFIFSYCLGNGELSPTKEKKQVSALYSDCIVGAYRLFNNHEAFDGVVNLYTLNQNPNQTYTVDPVLYSALEKAETLGGRHLYLEALAEEYRKAFYGQNDPYAQENDPAVNEEFAAFCQILTDFANDPQSVRLELGENNTVTLVVSDEYLAYAKEYDLSAFVGFHRLKNAFIIDYLAQRMIENGYTSGCISSYDGYVRNLDEDNTPYSINLFQLRGVEVYPAARMEYQGARATVTFRAYPMGEKDALSFCTLPDGRVITPYLNLRNGLYQTAANELVAYSDAIGCAELALKLWSIYTAEALNTEDLDRLQNIYWVWIDGTEIRSNDKALVLKDLYNDGEIVYTFQRS